MNKLTHRVQLLGLVVALILLLAACGGAAKPAETTLAPDVVAAVVEAPQPVAEPVMQHDMDHSVDHSVDHSAASSSSDGAIDPVAFHEAMRALWMDHVSWTRLFILSAAADSPDTDVVAARLLRNQDDIGEAVAAFYGEEAGAALTQLLKEHILIAGDLLTAAKAGDSAAVDAANAAWYVNADEIAVFLAGANPAWSEDAMKEMMRSHLDQTLLEATAHLTGDYETSVAAYDEAVDHILMMADALADGIVAQFPDRFGAPSLNASQHALSDAMRDLWEDHVIWTRLFIVSAVADSPDTNIVAARLLANQEHIGAAVASFYGEEAGAALTQLLKEHILIAGDLIAAAKAGDSAAVDAANAAWYVNADEIATFLAGANPNWPEAAMKDMMRSHLDQTLNEATGHLTGDYDTSISAYDEAVHHILMMADGLTNGILAQFPSQFAN